MSTTYFRETRIVQGAEGEARLARMKAELYGQITSRQSEVRGGTDGTQEADVAAVSHEEPREDGHDAAGVAQGEQGRKGEAPAGVAGQAVNFHHITGSPQCRRGASIYMTHAIDWSTRRCPCGYVLERL